MAKAWRIKGIGPQRSLEVCARRIITAGLQEMMSHKDGAADGTDIEFVHNMRVASRRLRAAMQNFAGCFEQKRKFRKHLTGVEKITRTMGDVRDLDVLIARFQEDLQTMPPAEQVGVRSLIRRLEERREQARKPMLKMFETLKLNGFAKKFLRFFGV